MLSESRGVIYTLFVAIVGLLVGISALLWVANTRRQRLEDETNDLYERLLKQTNSVRALQRQLDTCKGEQTPAPPADTLGQ